MARPRSLLADYAVYLLVRLIVCLIQMLSYRAACRLALGLAWLAYRLDRRHRLVACENLKQAFPGRYTDAELDVLVRSVYRHFCTLLMEIINLPRKVHLLNWRRYIRLEDRRMLECLLSGRPLMIVTGHFGNWEMGSYMFGLFGFRSYAIARPLDNRFLDDFLRRFRESSGQKVLAKKGDFDQMQAVLARGGVLATVADQDAGPRGLFVDFFGRPASTHKAIALLALEYGVPLMVAAGRKLGEPMRYLAQVQDVILPEDYQGRPDAVRAITQRFSTDLEQLVRAAPEQYFWLHRRWKHAPPQRKGRGAKESVPKAAVA